MIGGFGIIIVIIIIIIINIIISKTVLWPKVSLYIL